MGRSKDIYQKYVIELLEKARIAMKPYRDIFKGRNESKDRVQQISELIDMIKKGKITPKIYVLEPNTIIKWHNLPGSPVTIIHENRVVHSGDYDTWDSSRLHDRKGFHVIGRLTGSGEAGYIAIKEKKGKPVIAISSSGDWPIIFRKISDFDGLVSRLHGILAPHPTEDGKFIYIHFGKNEPKIERIKERR